MDYNNYGGNHPRFAGQPQNQPYTAGMPYFQQQQGQGLPNQRPPIQQNMQFGHNAQQQQTQGFTGGFGQGQFPRNPNPQMQQAFNQQQYQKMMQQQQRMAQEGQKLQSETRKKREFEMQQKRLQEFGRHGGGKKTGGGDLTRLIGSLAEKGGKISKPAPIQHVTTTSGKSLFSRPGGFYQAPQKQDHPEQHPQPHLNVPQQPQPGQLQDLQQYPEQPHTQQHPGQPHLQQFPGQTQAQQQPGPSSFPQHQGQPHLQQFPGQAQTQQLPGQSSFQQHQIQPHLQQFPGQTQQLPGQSSFSQHQEQLRLQQFPGQTQQLPGQSSFPQHQGQPHLQQFPGQTQQPPGQSSFPQHQGQSQNSGSQYQESSFDSQNLEKGASTGADDDFSDFQEAKPSLSGQGSAFPGQQGPFPGQSGSLVVSSSNSSAGPGSILSNQSGMNTQNNPSWQMSHNTTSTMATGFISNQMAHGINMVSGISTTAQTLPVTSSLGSGVIGQRARTDSQSSVSSNSSGGRLTSQAGHFAASQNLVPLSGAQGSSFVTQHRAGPTLLPASPGQEQFKQVEHHSDVPGHVVPGSDGGDTQDSEEPEDPIRKLYGVDLPDWCTTGIDLPGVYKDVKDAVTINGAIDTAKLYTVLLTSELHRDILGQLWSRVNKATSGQLNDMELRIMMGLIALGQTGLKVERLTIEKLATCKSAPIPSFPEDIFKSEESSWSFQKEPEEENKDDASSLPVTESSFVGWQGQPNNNYSNTTEPNNKYSVFRMDNTSTSLPHVSMKETAGSWPSSAPNQQVDAKGLQMFGHTDQRTQLSSPPEFQSFQGAVSSSEVDTDFGDFQGSVSSLDSIGGVPQQSGISATSNELRSDSSFILAASLEDFKLKSDTQEQSSIELFESFSSAKSTTPSKTIMPNHGGGSHGDRSHGDNSHGDINKPNAFATFPSIKMPPQAESESSFLNIPKLTPAVKLENKAEPGLANTVENSPTALGGGQENTSRTSDRYDFLRDLNSSAPDTSLQPPRKKDDSFGDFETFERATTHSEADDLGDLHATTTQSLPGNQNSSTTQPESWALHGFSSTQPSRSEDDFGCFKNEQFMGSNTTSSDSHLQDDFGDFADFQSTASSTDFSSGPAKVNDVPSLFPLNFNQDRNGQLKNDQSRQRSSLTASNSFANSVPLDSTQRYKGLSDEGEDMEKHDNVWGRCLNSCLLTLVTGTLAVQKMTDPTLKQEVLQSKKGIEYFTALKEVARVTQRIQFSLIKTEFANEKLKNILVEINQSWKNISHFLAGSTIEANVGCEDLSNHHIQSDEDKSLACGVCLLNVNKSSGSENKISYSGRDYHSTCANFWCNRVDSILPKLFPVNSLI